MIITAADVSETLDSKSKSFVGKRLQKLIGEGGFLFASSYGSKMY